MCAVRWKRLSAVSRVTERVSRERASIFAGLDAATEGDAPLGEHTVKPGPSALSETCNGHTRTERKKKAKVRAEGRDVELKFFSVTS